MLFPVKLSLPITMLLVLLSLIGCGEKTVIGGNVSKLEVSQSCIDCHEAAVSKVTGKSVIAEWKLSAHNLNNKAGCTDCHFIEQNHSLRHPDCARCHGGTPIAGVKGLPPYPIKNPDSYGSCAKCHTSAGGFGISDYDGITNNTLTSHFSTPTLAAYTSGKYKARYVTKNYEKSCSSCHNPHDTGSQMLILRQWARSGKGDVTATPWAAYDFRTRGAITPGATLTNSFEADCVRCHTSTGFLNYLSSRSIATFGTSKTEGKEVLACNVCHVDYSYAKRTVSAVTAYYNLSTTQGVRLQKSLTYPDVKESNVCLACHVGREIGSMIKDLAPSVFTNIPFISSHYLTGGAIIFQKSGYEFTDREYPSGQSTVGSLLYQHDSVGMGNLNGTGTSGPCVTCHLKPGRHTFIPIERTENSNPWLRQAVGTIVSPECVKCHDGGGGKPSVITKDTLNESKSGFYAALTVLKTELEDKGLYYGSGSIVTASGGKTKVSDWVTSFNSSIKSDVMGAAFNYVLLNYDFGAYAHNVFYAKRLLYDSIDLIDDGALNFSTCSTITVGNTPAFGYLCKKSITNSITERP